MGAAVRRERHIFKIRDTAKMPLKREQGVGKKEKKKRFSFTATILSLVYLRPFVIPYRKRRFPDARPRLITLKPVEERAGHRQYVPCFLCAMPERFDALFITKNASYSQITPQYLCYPCPNWGKIVFSHAAALFATL